MSEPDRITQKYLRRWPDSRRAKSWAGRMVHIETENGVWRTGGAGYTWAGKPDAWVLTFEEAQRQVNHCGPEKRAAFIAAPDRRPSPSISEARATTEVEVKALEWSSYGGLRWRAVCPLGRITVNPDSDRRFYVSINGTPLPDRHATSEIAMAAAQLDYATRIRSALVGGE